MEEKGLKVAGEDKPKPFRETWWRWIVLTLACFALVGSEFSFDNPQSLITETKDLFGIDEAKFTLLYTVYSMPNIVITLAGGFFLDKLGIRLGMFVFLCFTTTGQALFAVSAAIPSYGFAIFARVIFGCGSENLNVAQSTIVSKWFKGKELAFALGINVSAARLGSVVNDYIEPWLCHQASGLKSGVSIGYWFGFGLCLFSLCCGIVVGWMDTYADKRDRESGCVIEELDEVHLKDIFKFGLHYWLVSIVCVTVYMSLFPFMAIASGYFQQKYSFSSSRAGLCISAVYLFSAPATPFAGLLIDYVGLRTIFMMIASVSFLIAHLWLGFLTCEECYWGIGALIFIGLGHCLFSSSIWPCIPHVVEDNAIGTAFGLTTSLQNAGLALGPYLVGVIKDATNSYQHGYFWVSMFLAVVTLVGLLFGVILTLYDLLTTKVLYRKEGKNYYKLLAQKEAEADEDLDESERKNTFVHERRMSQVR